MTAYNRGQLAFAQARLEAGLTLYDPQRHNPRASSGREDPGILCLTTLVSILWLRGYPDQALQKLHEALSLAEHSADPLSRAMVLGQAAVLYQRRREGQAALASADAFLALTQEQGFSFRAATGMIYRGWALADCGDVKAGHIEEAFQILKKALAIAHSTGDRVYEAELWRLRGILMGEKLPKKDTEGKTKKPSAVFSGRVEWPGNRRQNLSNCVRL